jgi:hypothetical protein
VLVLQVRQLLIGGLDLLLQLINLRQPSLCNTIMLASEIIIVIVSTRCSRQNMQSVSADKLQAANNQDQ